MRKRILGFSYRLHAGNLSVLLGTTLFILTEFFFSFLINHIVLLQVWVVSIFPDIFQNNVKPTQIYCDMLMARKQLCCSWCVGAHVKLRKDSWSGVLHSQVSHNA